MSRAFQLLVAFMGLVLVACSVVVLAYAVHGGEQLSDLGWVVVVAAALLGALALHRAAAWNRPIICRRCGAALTREDVSCPRCGLDLEKTAWAAIGQFKLP